MKKILFGALILGIVLTIQLISIQRPYFGHFSSYQTVSASMSRNMLREDFSQILLPKTDLMIGKKKSMPLNQYPFHSLAAAVGMKLFGGNLEFWGRFQAIAFNLLSVLLMGLIAANIFGAAAGWVLAVLAALSPYTLIYGQTFMSESSALFCLLLCVYWLLCRPSDRALGFGRALAAGLALSVAITSRVHFVLILPVYMLYLFFSGKTKRDGFALSAVFTLSAIALPVAWYAYTYFVSIRADNIHTNLFLQLSGRSVGDRHYLTDPNYYRLVLDIFSQKMFAVLACPFLLIGLCLWGGSIDPETKRKRIAILGSCLTGFMIILLFPQKVADHEFYLYGLYPFLVMIAAYGIARIQECCPALKTSRVIGFCILAYLMISARYFFYPIYKYPDEDKQLLKMAEIIRPKMGSEDFLVILSRGYSALQYYADQPSWAINLTSLAKPLGYYFKNPRFSGADFKQLAALEEAMKDPVSWLGYLKGQGARYLIAPAPKDLAEFPELVAYIESHYQKIPTAENFFFYLLESPPASTSEAQVLASDIDAP